MDWSKWELFQVDERILPRGHEDRNFTHLQRKLLEPAGVPDDVVHPMPVERNDLANAAVAYARELEDYCGLPPVLDLVVLGLGSDGHTASLVPLDPVLHTDTAYVDVTGEYNGHRRMTLTYPVLNGARNVIWLVTGVEKADVLKDMEAGDPSLPASKVNRTHAVIFADQAAMSGMDPV